MKKNVTTVEKKQDMRQQLVEFLKNPTPSRFDSLKGDQMALALILTHFPGKIGPYVIPCLLEFQQHQSDVLCALADALNGKYLWSIIDVVKAYDDVGKIRNVEGVSDDNAFVKTMRTMIGERLRQWKYAFEEWMYLYTSGHPALSSIALEKMAEILREDLKMQTDLSEDLPPPSPEINSIVGGLLF